ncbi:hypothetical protein IV102_04785 [bacterium]|nr:hypothetical protein [bacterium]
MLSRFCLLVLLLLSVWGELRGSHGLPPGQSYSVQPDGSIVTSGASNNIVLVCVP